MTIMYIDDNVANKNVFIEAVKLVNPYIEIICTENGEKALAILSVGHLPEYIFLNSNISRPSCKVTLLAIKNILALRDTKVILFATSLNHKDIEEYKIMGVSSFLAMPTSADDLQIMVSLIFGFM